MEHQSMVAVATTDLAGQPLNWAAAKATGGTPWITPFGAVGFDSECWAGGAFEPARLWAQGGPLLEQGLISLSYEPVDGKGEPGYWWAWFRHDSPTFRDRSMLVAGLRALVHSRLGEAVDVPEVLLKKKGRS